MIWKISLRTKFLAIIIGVISLAGLTVIIFAQTIIHQKLINELQKKGVIVAKYIAEEGTSPVLTRDTLALQTIAIDYKKFEKDIVYIFFQDHKGEVLAHTFGETFPVGLREANIIAPSQEYNTLTLSTERGFILDIAVPILKGEAGVVRLGILEEPIRKDVANIVWLIIGGIGGISILGGVLTFILVRAITSPLSKLTMAAEAISAGDLEQKVYVKTGDEISELAAAFNKMVDDLQKVTVSRKYLEELVKERTVELTALNEQLQLKIAEHMKAEDALKKAKEFSETVLNSMNDSVSIIDVTNYKVVAANSVYFKQLGLKEEEALGRPCYEVTHHRKDPCQPPTDPCPLLDTMRTGEHTSYEHIHYKKDGTKFYVEVSTSPIRNEKGDITHVVHVARDISDRKRLEEQLRHSQRLEAVGHLAGGIAHDFNNILTAIIGYGNFLRRKMKEDEPLRTYVEQILAASERATNLTQSLLAFSRKQIINPRPVNLNDIVKRMEKLLNRLIGEDIELKTILADTDLTVMADSGQIEQVMMNLATNARDAMPEGGFLIIETKPIRIDETYAKGRLFAKPGMYAVLSVTDTGIGMDEETRNRIFEPFFTTKEVGKGTGLGLSIVYGIIKQHNGDIHVYSEPGRGTTFRIYLPLIKAEVEEERIKELPPLRGGTETILVAEDEADIRAIIREELVEYGYTVMEAEDGEDAIRLFTENKDKIQLALLDVIMPKKNGWEVHERIKKINPDIKVIFMSGYTADIIHRKGIFEAELDFIPKPISPDDLMRKVREVLDR
jgi:PAS domain S-box-containing protein